MKQLREEDKILTTVKNIHMIGIGGSGMCPLAEILYNKGYTVTGSDNNESDPLKRVRAKGIKVFMGHNAENIGGAQLVVYSAAIKDDNAELSAAKKQGIPTMERSFLLGALTRMYQNVIGVCGTHGKTSVTSMITQVLVLCGKDPTAVIGGKLPLIGSNSVTGNGDLMVCEACEFVDTFLKLSPDISVLLNIDNDHLDYFKTMENLTNSFKKFIGMSSVAVVNGDDSLVMGATNNISAKIITFGFGENNMYKAKNEYSSKRGWHFEVYKGDTFLGEIELSIPGKHNVYNALAAFAVCHYLGIEANGIIDALQKFGGAGRRFEFIGEFGNGFTLADDYAHHPTEITATLSAAKQLPYKKVVCVFQPFTFSRTALLLNEFIEALSLADEVVLTEIMGSREKNVYGVTSNDIAKKLNNVRIINDFNEIADYLLKTKGKEDLVITMGGGDIYKVCHIIKEK